MKTTYRKLNKTFHRKVWFIYVDANNASAPLIEEMGLKTSRELVHMDYLPYTVKCLKVPIKKEEEFLKCMEQLKRKLFLMGYASYEEKSAEIFQVLNV